MVSQAKESRWVSEAAGGQQALQHVDFATSGCLKSPTEYKTSPNMTKKRCPPKMCRSELLSHSQGASRSFNSKMWAPQTYIHNETFWILISELKLWTVSVHTDLSQPLTTRGCADSGVGADWLSKATPLDLQEITKPNQILYSGHPSSLCVGYFFGYLSQSGLVFFVKSRLLNL